MMNKQNKEVIRITLLITIILITITLTQATPCTENTQNTCGYTINQTGHGAVELCETCFVCGAEDGICPAWYSTGETHDDLILVNARKGTEDRPQADNSTILYDTPNDACNSIQGTFQAPARIKNNKTQDWEDDTQNSITGTTQMDTLNNYVQVRCANVPKRPSCDECIDVDCITELKGVVYTEKVNGYEGIENAEIILGSDKGTFKVSNERRNKTNSQGEYLIENAYMGNVEITCLADGYKPITRSVKLVPGTNIVDCQLEQDTCTEDCSYAASGICSADCAGYNNCKFPDDKIKDVCHKRPKGFFYTINVEPNEPGLLKVNGTTCCNNEYETRIVSAFNPEASGNIKNLITRSYNKIFSTTGRPGELKIMIYN